MHDNITLKMCILFSNMTAKKKKFLALPFFPLSPPTKQQHLLRCWLRA